jgi:DNA-binding phage protein
MPGQATYAISMGDLVRSTQHTDPNELHLLFNQVVAQANQRFAESIASPLTITLGDEFQGLSTSLRRGVELNHFVRMSLLLEGVSTRLVLGIGAIDTAVNPKNAWNMMGEGLSKAREKRNAKKSFNCYRFSFPEHAQLERLLDSVGESLTKVESEWTKTQMAYVARKLSQPEKSISLIARDLGISRNSLYKVLRSANADFYTGQLESIAEALQTEDSMRASTCET